MTRIKLLTTIQLGRVQRPKGSVLEVEDDIAAHLVKSRSAEVTDASFPAPPDKKPPLSDDDLYYVNLNAIDAIAHIAGVESIDELRHLALLEREREKGPRKTVVSAFEARKAELEPDPS